MEVEMNVSYYKGIGNKKDKKDIFILSIGNRSKNITDYNLFPPSDRFKYQDIIDDNYEGVKKCVYSEKRNCPAISIEFDDSNVVHTDEIIDIILDMVGKNKRHTIKPSIEIIRERYIYEEEEQYKIDVELGEGVIDFVSLRNQMTHTPV